MSYAAAMTWEMDGFRLVRTRPRVDRRDGMPAAVPDSRGAGPRQDVRQRDLARPQHVRQEHNPALPGRSGAAAGSVASGADRVRGTERVLEADWQIVVQRCLDGDSGAWTELVKSHHRR